MKNFLLYLLLIIFFYFLTLFQTSFLVHFNVWGVIPNFVFILVVIINLFENPKSYFGIILATVTGLFLDIFSERPLGFYIIILGATVFFIKFVFRNYVRIPFTQGS